MTIGAQDVGLHVSIAPVAFAAGEQGIDDQAGWPLDGDRQLSRWRDPLEPDCHITQAAPIVAHIEAGHDATSLVDDTCGMAYTTPVQACVKWLVLISLVCGRLTRAGRSRGSLTDWRSGWHALALHPVVHCYLPAPPVRLGLSRAVRRQARDGRHGRCSDWQILTPLHDFASSAQKVHQ